MRESKYRIQNTGYGIRDTGYVTRYPKDGFTLAEVLLAAGILAFGLCGILVTYMNMFVFSDLGKNLTLSTNALQARAEAIKRTNFDGLLALNGSGFNIAGFSVGDARGAVEVTDTAYSDLKRVRLTACFKNHARVIGEDANLNASLEGSEDSNNNGRLDSPAELVFLIAR